MQNEISLTQRTHTLINEHHMNQKRDEILNSRQKKITDVNLHINIIPLLEIISEMTNINVLIQ